MNKKFNIVAIVATVILSLFSAFITQAAEPTIPTVSINAVTGTCDEINLSFVPGDGSRRLIVASANVPVSSYPVDGQGYASGSIFGTGSNLGSNNFVVYSGSGTSTTVSGLAGGTAYFFAVFEYNGFGSNSDYLLTGYPESSAIAAGVEIALSSSSGDMCVGDSVQLTVAGAESYLWTPSGSLSSNTDSVVWAHPSSTTTYSVTGTNSGTGCTDLKTVTITVHSLPNANLSNPTDRCINAGMVTLNGTPSGGVFSGPAVTGNQFNPVVAGPGTHLLTYTYTDVHGCVDFDDETIEIFPLTDASLSSFGGICVDAGSIVLSGGSPAGGTYSGTGVSSGQFNPLTAGPGTHTISYIYTNGSGCKDTATSNINVYAKPNVVFGTLPSVCLNAMAFTLTQGTPAGGIYSGDGVAGDEFSPLVTGAGSYELTYTYTDSNGCTNSDTSVQTVFTLPAVTFSPLTQVCVNTGPVALTGGSPAGGVYSGTGVGGSTFYTGIAGAGSHIITYTYTSANNCTNSATRTMTVNPLPTPDLGPDVLVCAGSSVQLTGGVFSSYLWSTGGSGMSTTLDSSGRGIGTFQVILAVANATNCVNRDTINVTFDLCDGIESIFSNANFAVYPNPSSGDFSFSGDRPATISVYDMKGSLLLREEYFSGLITFGEVFSSGTYLLKVINDKTAYHTLIIKN